MNIRQDYGGLAPSEVLFRMCEGVTMSASTESRSRKFTYERLSAKRIRDFMAAEIAKCGLVACC
jgi:hypothetical protein